ncbi:hypothetical protein LTR17_015161 [Elasticomyces elasticus]|nr:hypothetical protein LTR17_015161 [Elasticomyces elasticus]
MAAHKVLSLPELLEPILLDLSTRDLLFAQKVCKTWHEIIASTPSVQKALFFRPSTEAEMHSISCPKWEDIVDWLPDDHDDLDYVALLPNPLLVRGYKDTDWLVGGRLLICRPPHLDGEIEPSCNRMYLTQPPTAMGYKWEAVADIGAAVSYTFELATEHKSFVSYGEILEGGNAWQDVNPAPEDPDLDDEKWTLRDWRLECDGTRGKRRCLIRSSI